MNILAIETASSACSVAVLNRGDSFFLEEDTPQAHARHILPMVEKALNQAGVAPQQLDCLAFDQGPGAFTGLRIATAVIQGLAMGWDKPVVAVNSLEALAYQARADDKPMLALLDARMGEVYAAVYQSGQCLQAPVVAPPEQIAPWLDRYGIEDGIGIAGDHMQWVQQQGLNWQAQVPRADAIAFLAKQRAHEAKKVTEQVPMPLYLRDKVADKPKAPSQNL